MASVNTWRDVPAILRRCVVSVYFKTTGGSVDGVVRAFKICRDQLAKQGYLFHRGENQILESIQLTGKGFLRNLEHENQGFAGTDKDLKFEKLFQMLAPKLWEYDGPGGQQPPQGQPSIDGTATDQELSQLLDSQAAINDIAGINELYPKNNPPKK